jgi:hypothetical protein
MELDSGKSYAFLLDQKSIDFLGLPWRIYSLKYNNLYKSYLEPNYMGRVLAERVDAEKSRLFLVSPNRLEEEVMKVKESESLKAAVAKRAASPDHESVFWINHGDSIQIDEEDFNHDYLRTCGAIINYPYIPILGVGDVLKFTKTDAFMAEQIHEALNPFEDLFSGHTQPFVEHNLREFVAKIRGYLNFAGDLHLLSFSPEDETGNRETLLYFTPPDGVLQPNENGIICLDGKPISRDVYANIDGGLLMGFYYNQDERRGVALKGEITLTPLGKMTVQRNAFYPDHFDKQFAFGKLILLYDTGDERDRGNLVFCGL